MDTCHGLDHECEENAIYPVYEPTYCQKHWDELLEAIVKYGAKK